MRSRLHPLASVSRQAACVVAHIGLDIALALCKSLLPKALMSPGMAERVIAWWPSSILNGLPWSRICLQCRRPWFSSWVWRIPWRRDRLPTPGFLGFPGGSGSKVSACHVGDLGLIPGLERSLQGGRGNPLQCSCLENPHGQRSLVGYSPRGHKESDTTKRLGTAHLSIAPSVGSSGYQWPLWSIPDCQHLALQHIRMQNLSPLYAKLLSSFFSPTLKLINSKPMKQSIRQWRRYSLSIFFYWRIVDLQCVNFCYTAKLFSDRYVYIYTFF